MRQSRADAAAALAAVIQELRNHDLCGKDCTPAAHVRAVYQDLEAAMRLMREYKTRARVLTNALVKAEWQFRLVEDELNRSTQATRDGKDLIMKVLDAQRKRR